MKKITKFMALAAMWVCFLPSQAKAATELIPVGQVVGLELQDGTVTVVAFDEELGSVCQKAGVEVGDVIQKVNNVQIHTAEDLRNALEQSDGSVRLQIIRDGKSKEYQMKPQITKDGPKLGVYLRQGVTGIGMVSWYDPESGSFGTLGHGVNNRKGKLLELTKGNAYEARVLSVKKGKAGNPGQLIGAIERIQPIGTLEKNTAQGVFGISQEGWEGETLPVAKMSEIRTGSAVIRSTVSGVDAREYSVEILKVYPKSKQTGRNMLIRVTDPELLKTTGGIVQGMSGSPLVQDGKLIGAVTHVLVNDPTMGYGIFIENMLEAAG